MHTRVTRDGQDPATRRRATGRTPELAALQRAVGNRGMAQLLRDAVPPPPKPPGALATPEVGATEPPATGGRQDMVFIMGNATSDGFYKSAQQYYKKTYPKAKMVTTATTLADVIKEANKAKTPIENLFIVSHGNAEGTMYFGLGIGAPTMLQFQDLQADLAAMTSVLPKANQKVLDEKTTVRIKGCNVGRSTGMLNLLDKAFGGKVTVIAPTHAQMFGKSAAIEALGEYYVSVPGHPRMLDDEVHQLFKTKYDWVSEMEWRELFKHMKEHKINDPIPVNNMAIVPRNSSETEAWFKTQADWRNLKALGYTDVAETKRKKVTGMAKVEIEMTASGSGLEPRKVTVRFDERPADSKLIADAKLQHGLPESSEFTVAQPGAGSLRVDVVARRTTWVIEDQVIKVGGKDVRGGRGQADWYQSSTFK